MMLSRRRMYMYRGSKKVLEEKNKVYEKYKVIVELPDDFTYAVNSELMGLKFPYKIGDGEHTYCELPYEDEKILVGFVF